MAAQVYYYPSTESARIIDFVALSVVSLQWRHTNPLWTQIIGPPGSGKTAHVALLEGHPSVIFVSRLSKNSLISGYRSETDKDFDPSLLKLLDGKVLVVKDFTCILQGPKEERDSVVGQLRDAYDGKASRALGNIGFAEYSARFNCIVAVTNLIDGYYSINQQLGERFVSRREYSIGRREITEASFDNALNHRNDTSEADLRCAFQELIDSVPAIKMNEIHWPRGMRRRATRASDIIAACRSHVMRNRDGAISSRANPEVGSRLVSQVAQCVCAYCLLNGLATVTNDAWTFGGARVLRDTLPTPIAWTLFQILSYTDTARILKTSRMPEFTISELVRLTRMNHKTVSQVITDLYYNGLLECRYSSRGGMKQQYFSLGSEHYATLKNTHIFDGYEDSEVHLGSLNSRLQRKERGI